jgi:hypothetical protein
MTSKPKVYQNYRFDELIAFAQQNPHRCRRLTSLEITRTEGIKSGSREQKKDTMEGFGLHGYTLYDLQPTGLLSMMACMEDPHAYAFSTPAIRAQQAIEWCTRLQQRTDELRNGPLSRKRKRVYELLGAVYNESTQLEEKDYTDLFQAMEALQESHFILMNRAVQESMESDAKDQVNRLSFSSSPLTWKRDRPIWIVDSRCRWMAVPTDTAEPLGSVLESWLPQMAEKGWSIQWPEVEGTKAEVVEQLITRGTWQEVDKKLTKDILAIRLGKEKTLERFRTWTETRVEV